MKSFKEFTNTEYIFEDQYVDISYRDYQIVLEAIENGDDIEMLAEGIASNIGSKLKGVLGNFLKDIRKITSELQLPMKDVIMGLKHRSMFDVLKAFGFKIKALVKAVSKASDLLRDGLMVVFDELASTGVLQKLHAGTMKIDEVLSRHPILKRLTGIVIVGILVYIWLNMTFIGNLDYDFNFSNVIKAFNGSFTVNAIFSGKSGLMLITMFATGSVFSFPWLGGTAANLTLAVIYTSYVLVRDQDDIARRIRARIKTKRIKRPNPTRVPAQDIQ